MKINLHLKQVFWRKVWILFEEVVSKRIEQQKVIETGSRKKSARKNLHSSFEIPDYLQVAHFIGQPFSNKIIFCFFIPHEKKVFSICITS